MISYRENPGANPRAVLYDLWLGEKNWKSYLRANTSAFPSQFPVQGPLNVPQAAGYHKGPISDCSRQEILGYLYVTSMLRI